MPTTGELVDMIASVTGAPITPEEYDGFVSISMTLSASEAVESSSNQTHIPVTDPNEGMLLFPVVTSSAYIAQPGEKKDEKSRYFLRAALRLFRPNVVNCLEFSVANASELKHDEAFYQRHLDRVKGSNDEWLDAFTHVTLAYRKNKQWQFQIGIKTKDDPDFTALRHCVRAKDLLVFLKREPETFDVFAIRSEDLPEGDWAGSVAPANRDVVVAAGQLRTDEIDSSLGAIGADSEIGEATETQLSRVVTACELYGERSIVALAGVPGTGKTMLASLAAHLIAGEGARVRRVQFHPGYTYEEFMEGRLLDAEGGVIVQPGVFLEWNQKAARDPDGELYVLVIDELTRANLSAVLGELMTYVEYRNEPFVTPYGRQEIKIAHNLRILATYNPLDRSAVEIDDALLRRLRLIDCPPSTEQLVEMLDGALPDEVTNALVAVFSECESRFPDNFSSHMPFGHGIFAHVRAERPDLFDLWDGRIKHMLRRPQRDPHEFTKVIEENYPWRDPSYTAETGATPSGEEQGAAPMPSEVVGSEPSESDDVVPAGAEVLESTHEAPDGSGS